MEETRIIKEVFVERLKIEFSLFIQEIQDESLDNKSVKQITMIASEIVDKENIIDIIEFSEMSETEIRAMNVYATPLDSLYEDWLEQELKPTESLKEQLTDSVYESVSNATRDYIDYFLPQLKEMNS